MRLDYSALRSAIGQLEKSLAYAHSPAALADPGLREQLRNSVIQCFEFTYELSWKMLKRYLEETEASPGLSHLKNIVPYIAESIAMQRGMGNGRAND